MMQFIQLFSKAVGPVAISCIVREKHLSEIGITTNPIESGADVTDHAYVMPKKLTLEVAGANATATFNALVRFQESRVPFVIVTGLTVYKNMLIRSIDAERTASFTQVLRATLELQEVIIVSTAYATGGDEGGATSPGGASSAGQRSGGASSAGQARPPTPATASDSVTATRAAGPVQRGDAPAVQVPATQSRSILSGMFA